jgi:hypothetical protein
MRPIELLLSAGLALSSIPASAGVIEGDAPQNTMFAYASCPAYEGYPDCHPDRDTAMPPRSRATVRRRS